MGEKVVPIEFPLEEDEVHAILNGSDKKRRKILLMNSIFHFMVTIVCIVAIVLLVPEILKEIRYIDYISDHPEEDFLGFGAVFSTMAIILLSMVSLCAVLFGPLTFFISIRSILDKKVKGNSRLVWANLIMIFIGSAVLLGGGIFTYSYDLTYLGPSLLRDFKIIFMAITGTSAVLALISGFYLVRIRISQRKEMMIINSRSAGAPLEL
ncbi:MAG: hypothetical protein ACMUHM_07315 [Thermoplasmatota archaeon]